MGGSPGIRGSFRNAETDAFFESSYTRRKSDQLLAPTPLFIISEGITVSADNIYNPYDRDFIDIRRRMVEADSRNFEKFRDVMTLLKDRLPET